MAMLVAKLLLLCAAVGVATAQTYANFTGDAALTEPTSLSSSGGSLAVTLAVDASPHTVDWFTSTRRLYNASMVGPTIRLKQGDTFTFTIVNNLVGDYYPNDTCSYAVNNALVSCHVLNSPNTTNVHLHGVHVSPNLPSNNIHYDIGPSSQYTYTYTIPSNHPPGTYWYHPHSHGSAAFQIESGMAGALIIDDPTAHELNSYPEKILVVQLYRYLEAGGFTAMQTVVNDYFSLTDTALVTHLTGVAADVNYQLINGQLWPNMTLDAGIYTRLRIVNTQQLYSMGLYFSDPSGSGNTCTVYEIAVDGVYLDSPRVPKLSKSFIPCGGRLDILVKCDTAGQYELRSIQVNNDQFSFGFFPPLFTGLIAHVNVAAGGASTPTALPSALPTKPAYFADLQSKTESELGGRFVVEVTPSTTLNREDFTYASYYRYRMEVGSIQEVIFTNAETAVSHRMYMNVNHMQVVSYNAYTGPVAIGEAQTSTRTDPVLFTFFNQSGVQCTYQHEAYTTNQTHAFVQGFSTLFLGSEDSAKRALSIGYHTIGDWVDVIQIPPLANVTARFVADSFTGPIAIHDHTIQWADRGMKMVLEVVSVGANLTANVQHNGTYPWACMTNDPNSLPFARASAANIPMSIFALFGSLMLATLMTLKST